jgi:flagellar FliJ protein
VKRFRFRLQRVLDLREQHEKDRARSLGEAQSDEQRQRERLEEAASRLESAAASVRGKAAVEPVPAGTLRNLGLAVEAAQENVNRAEDRHREAQANVEEERARFHEARKDRRVVERLRERREETWTEEATRADQKEIDQIAARRWKKEDQS